MTTHVTGQAAVAAAAPTLHLATFRRNILAVVVGNPLFSDAEQLRANHNASTCTDAVRLVLWLKNVRRVAAEREHAQGCALLAEGIAQFEAKLAGATAPATTALVPTTPATVPAWLTLTGCITRAQRQELERRLRPQVGRSHWASFLLSDMDNWSAARATAELLKLGVCNVPNEVKRDLRFSVGGTAAPGLLPRREYMAFQRVRRVVLPAHKDYQIAQPGEGFDYCLGNN